MAEKSKRLHIGERLVENGIISEEQLKTALKKRSSDDKLFGKMLVELGYVSEEDVAKALSEQMGIAYVDLHSYSIDTNILSVIPEKLVREYCILPLFRVEDTLVVAMADRTFDVKVIDMLRKVSKSEIEPVLGTESSLGEAINRYYGGTKLRYEEAEEEKPERGKGAKKASLVESGPEREIAVKDLTKLAQESKVIKTVDLILAQAVKDKASDIHVEPSEKRCRLRFRIDGVLYDVAPALSKNLELALISRIKIMANLDIAEKRLPQDGRILMKIKDRDIDFRVSTFPTIYGENLVLRILDKSGLLLDLTKLGFLPKVLKNFQEVITKPNGIVLVTGPTGSGKTTTLYSALSEINSPDKNIITLEDPVEYRLGGIRQCQINVRAGLTFSSGLRSILRQDPDIIMIGEIRDLETADIAVHAALTGHLVLSTMHTNDAPSSITRLIDMGVEPFLVSSSIICILAQRLVRMLCPKCKKPYDAPGDLVAKLELPPHKRYTFYKETGCGNCKNSGYKGRTSLFEQLMPDDEIKELIIRKTSAEALMKRARAKGMKTLREAGLEKVIDGTTSLSEVMRVT